MHDRDWIWVAPTAWIIGLGALLCDHFEPSRWLVMVMHTLFAVATCIAICLVLIPKARALAALPGPELYLFTRLVSHWAYILLYGLAVARVSLYLYDIGQHCALCGGRDAWAVRPLDDFQFYVGSCVIPLWLVRAMVLALPFRCSNEQRALS